MRQKKVHFIGIGGIGMSALARIAHTAGWNVSGSDRKKSQLLSSLCEEGMTVYDHHSQEWVEEGMTVVYSSDIPQEHIELQAATRRYCPTLHRSQFLQQLLIGKKPLAVMGSHGKTTTSALLTHVLLQAGFDPSYAIGGILIDSKKNGYFGTGDYFVFEADESDGSFLSYSVDGAILTSVDSDHLNLYGSKEKLAEKFTFFFEQCSSNRSWMFYNRDEPLLCNQLSSFSSYGFAHDANLCIDRYTPLRGSTLFDLRSKDNFYPDIVLSLMGRHNAMNGAAVFQLALALGVPEEMIRRAFVSFMGVQRRQERLQIGSLELIDDYAHHPTAIRETLGAIKEASRRRIISIYQPHRYSRFSYTFEEHFEAFSVVDKLYLTDVYSAGEEPLQTPTAKELASSLRLRGVDVTYVGDTPILEQILPELKSGDHLITLGAGDITEVKEAIQESHRAFPKRKVALIFGGPSCEHEISLLTARRIAESLLWEKNDLLFFGITKAGYWHHARDLLYLWEEYSFSHQQGEDPFSAEILEALCSCDVVIPALHGPYGEDGSLQGLCESLNLPYIGCDVEGCAVSMHKGLAKLLAVAAGLEVAPFLLFDEATWRKEEEGGLSSIKESIGFPLFIKPVHLGSTLGVYRVEEEDKLRSLAASLFQLDRELIVEREVVGRELEFCLFGDDELTIFPPGEVFSGELAYSYEYKYGFAGKATRVDPVADLPPHLMKSGEEFARKLYRLFRLKGFARIDCFLVGERYLFNEVNPFPGFTQRSLYPMVLSHHGVSLAAFFEEQMDLAILRHRDKKRRLMNHRLLMR